MTVQPPPGFEPASPLEPVWLHTIELNRDRRLAGAVLVVDEQHLDAIGDLTGNTRGWVEEQQVHAEGPERYLKLSRVHALLLHHNAERLRLRGPGAEISSSVYYATIELTNIVYHEDEGE